MTRQATDNLYIDLEYFTPEEYYTYEANASAALSTQATFVCNAEAGAVKDFTVALSATATQTTENTRIVNFVAPLGTAFNSTMTVEALRITDVTLISAFTQTANVQRNRAVDLALSTIANLNAQAARTRDVTIGLTASATLSVELTQLVLVDFSATLTTTVSLTAQGKGFVVSSPVVFRGVGRPEINYTVTKFGAGSLFLNGTNSYLYAADKDTRFDIPSSSGGALAGQFTIEAWIYPTSSKTAFIVGQWQGNSSSTQGWKLEQVGSGVFLTVRTDSSTTQSIGTAAVDALNFDEWNHVAVCLLYTSDAADE